MSQITAELYMRLREHLEKMFQHSLYALIPKYNPEDLAAIV